jgi:hypothetical protein
MNLHLPMLQFHVTRLANRNQIGQHVGLLAAREPSKRREVVNTECLTQRFLCDATDAACVTIAIPRRLALLWPRWSARLDECTALIVPMLFGIASVEPSQSIGYSLSGFRRLRLTLHRCLATLGLQFCSTGSRTCFPFLGIARLDTERQPTDSTVLDHTCSPAFPRTESGIGPRLVDGESLATSLTCHCEWSTLRLGTTRSRAVALHPSVLPRKERSFARFAGCGLLGALRYHAMIITLFVCQRWAV